VSAGFAHAQTATVQGIVNEIAGDQYYPIPFARVSLGSDDFTTQPIVPDIEGKFAFEDIPAGVYSLSVSAVGFESLAQEIKVEAGDTLRVRIRLGDRDIAGIMVEPDNGYASGQRLGGSEE